MKTPDKIWCNVRSLLSQKTDNGRRQSMKRCRRTFNAFLDTVCDVCDTQMRDGHDFVVEMPHSLTKMCSDRFNGLLKNSEVYGVPGLGRGNEFGKVWWLASSKELKLQLQQPRYPSLQKSVMYGLADTIARKEPVRLHKLRRSVDARIRATGMYADENMTELRTYLLNRHKHVNARTK